MITEETVFILGAGASAPYGYPTGKKLRHRICKSFTIGRNIMQRLPYYEKIREKRILSEINEFKTAFENSSIRSIDLFLAMNPFFSYIGKIAIIQNIIMAESSSKFRLDMRYNQKLCLRD